jgi:subtilisin family serine protease
MRIPIQEIDGVEWIGPLTADVKVSDSVKDDIDPRFDLYGLMLQTLTPCHMRAEGSEARTACTEEAYQTLLADFQFQMLQMKYQATLNISSGATGFLALKWNPAATVGTENLARQRFSKWASSRLEVHFVDIMPAIKTGKAHNYYAGPLVKSRDYRNGGMVSVSGLQGEGQIVGVSDTGIDYDHCYFWDPAYPIPFNTINLNHRKIVYYDTAMGDNKDLPDGHGTHIVCMPSYRSPPPSAYLFVLVGYSGRKLCEQHVPSERLARHCSAREDCVH